MRPQPSPHRGWHRRAYLPHCDFPGLIQSVSIRLFDSVPQAVIERWRRELEVTHEKNLRAKLCTRIEAYSDMGYGCCLLAEPRTAKIVESGFLHFDGTRYDLLAWCVMPNHAHIVFVPRADHSMSKILHSWKSHAAHKANQLLDRNGDFWFPDYFDEFMRSTKHLESTIDYVELNPDTAKLVATREQWAVSSAAAHHWERVRANRTTFSEVNVELLPEV